MMMLRATSLILIGFFMIFGPLFLAGCGSDEKKGDTAEGAYELAQQYDKDERYEEAIRRYQEIKNKFPYSKYAVLSELAIADSNYRQESYPEAQVAYQSFKDLHPKHPQIDYVTFRLAMSYYNQLPPTSDRDLALASSTIVNFDEVIHQYPNSEYVKEAKEKKAAVVKLLAEKEMYIADFYFKKGQWDSARMRYEGEVKKYPGQEFEAKAMSRAVICAARASEMDRAHELLSQLRDKYPNSSELKAAEGEVK
jgi:outer membrane protein assembly factor BamD